MKTYRVIVTETQFYEVYVKAKNEERAKEIALENYGCDGEIFNTNAEVVEAEEDE